MSVVQEIQDFTKLRIFCDKYNGKKKVNFVATCPWKKMVSAGVDTHEKWPSYFPCDRASGSI